jgi:uncharacterized glyoxalase superfamily protein PhnB
MKTKSIIPILRILDERKAKEFYVDFLDFKIDFEHKFEDDFPIYMQVSKENWYIHLSEHQGDCSTGSAIMLEMDGVKAYQKELLEKKYKDSKPNFEKTEWDTIEMTINDPFGNRLTFFENI